MGAKYVHKVSQATRIKISQALDGNFYGVCDYCGSVWTWICGMTGKRKEMMADALLAQDVVLPVFSV